MKKFNAIFIIGLLLLTSCSRQDAPVRVEGEKISRDTVVLTTLAQLRVLPTAPDSTYRYCHLPTNKFAGLLKT